MMLLQLCGSSNPKEYEDDEGDDDYTTDHEDEDALEGVDTFPEEFFYNIGNPFFPGHKHNDKYQKKKLSKKLQEEKGPTEPVMDLCQMLSLLFIPFLRNGNVDGTNQEMVYKVIEIVFDTLKEELSSSPNGHNKNSMLQSQTSTTTDFGLGQGSVYLNEDGILVIGRATMTEQQQQIVQEEEVLAISVDVLRDLFFRMGEHHIEDEVLEEMMISGIIATSNGQKPPIPCMLYLTKSWLLHVLTYDVQLWNNAIDKTQSTHWEDVQRITEENKSRKRRSSHKKSNRLNDVERITNKKVAPHDMKSDHAVPFQVAWTASHVDNTADTYRSTVWFALSWVTMVFVYLCYFSNTNIKFSQEHWEDLGCVDHFGCDIALALTNWSIVFLELMILGFIWIMSVNMGNSQHPIVTDVDKVITILQILWGMFVVSFATIFTFFFDFNWNWINTEINLTYIAGYWITFVLGILILFCQIYRVISLFVVSPHTQGNQAKQELQTKMAATTKMHTLIEHAVLLHQSPSLMSEDDENHDGSNGKRDKDNNDKSIVSTTVKELSKKLHEDYDNSKKKSNKERSGTTKASTSQVMFNYSHMQDTEEPTGGIAWTYKKLFNGALQREEGIYLFGRLLAINTVQFLVVGILIGGFTIAIQILDILFEPKNDGCTYRITGQIITDNIAEVEDTFEEDEDEAEDDVDIVESTVDDVEEDLSRRRRDLQRKDVPNKIGRSSLPRPQPPTMAEEEVIVEEEDSIPRRHLQGDDRPNIQTNVQETLVGHQENAGPSNTDHDDDDDDDDYDDTKGLELPTPLPTMLPTTPEQDRPSATAAAVMEDTAWKADDKFTAIINDTDTIQHAPNHRYLQDDNHNSTINITEICETIDDVDCLNLTTNIEEAAITSFEDSNAMNETAGYTFLGGTFNTILDDAGEFAGHENWTIDNWNVNDTHFFDGFNLFEGQFPTWNGTSPAPTVCYDLYSTNGTDVWLNEAAAQNEVLDLLELHTWQYRLAASMGFMVALLATLGIALVYIPSYVSSVLKLRSGYDPSLKSTIILFKNFRKAPDKTSVLWGSALWGILYTAGLTFLLFTTVTFLAVWKVTRPYLKTITANLIGIATTILIKTLIMKLLRGQLFTAGGFYRKRPAGSNMMNVVLEAWSLGTSIGTVTSRAIKLILITFFYIGRIDTPMLAPGVGYIRTSPLDSAPNAFRQDLLIHEAHRHPYIERLGLLYLLKLYNGEEFGNRAGAHWRLLFTLALLPWMRNYRIKQQSGKDKTDDDDKEEEDRTGPTLSFSSSDSYYNNSFGGRHQQQYPNSNGRMMMSSQQHHYFPNLWNPNEDDIPTLMAKYDELKYQVKELKHLLKQQHAH